jgi:hypothetical protein
MPQFKLELPSSIHMDVLYDRSDTIRESYRDVQFTMVLTLALVIMVIFVFLRNVWATVIPSLALPFSIIGTFAVMYMLGYSLDNLSMMALILSVGFVVDDADRDAREHLPPRRNGRGSVVRVARRLARDRLHDRLDDAARWPPCSSRCSSWVACSDASSASSRSRSASPSSSRASCR